MKRLLTSGIWTWLTLALALVCILSSAKVIELVTEGENSVAHNIQWIQALTRIDRAVWDLARLGEQEVRAKRQLANMETWPQVSASFREQVSREKVLLSSRAPELVRILGSYPERLESSVKSGAEKDVRPR